MKRFLIAFAFAACACVCFGQSIQLRVKSKAGDIQRYKMSASLGFGDGKRSLAWTSTFTQKLTKVEKGLFYWETGFHTDSVKAMGMPGEEERMKKLGATKITFIENDRAEVQKAMVGARTIPAYPSANLPLPAKAIKVGQTWTGVMHVGPKPVPVTYRLASFKHVGKKLFANVQGTFHKTARAMATKPLQYTLDTSTGRLESAEAHIIFGDKGKQSTMNYKITRVR